MDAPASAYEVLEEVLVTGEQPGPAMWRVRKGDHSLWIVGDLRPLPAKMTWRSRQVDAVVKQSGEILGRYEFRADLKGGLFRALSLLPAVMKLDKNADGRTLQQVMPPEVYARYSAAYRRFHGRSPDPKDRLRPFAAADELFDKALERTGLSEREVVWPQVKKQAKQHKVRLRKREFVVPVDEPKALIEEVRRVPIEKEVACLVATLDRLDNDLPNMRRRAEAWAVGDVATLQALPWVDEAKTCLEAILEQPKLRAMFDEQKAKVDADWPGIVEYLLLAHETSLTVVPIQQLWGEDGVLARLRSRGYVIEEPVSRRAAD